MSRAHLRCSEGAAEEDETMPAINTITDEQIGQLANEAARAGDHDMVAICEIALGAGSGMRATEVEQRHAREECARVIAEAAAQS